MKQISRALVFLFVLSVAAPALAWDGAGLWYAPADGASPGGGGFLGTGSARDRSITCAHCHVDGAGKIDAKLELDPPLGTVNGQSAYEPGKTYTVTVSLIGEYLGIGQCDQYMMRTNNMAVRIEDAGGKAAGALASDSGQSAASCPSEPPQSINGTTVLYRDCLGVVGSGAESMTSWTFSWTAPAAGAGTVTMYYGVVDGNCDMSSRGDDVKVGKLDLGEAAAALAPPPLDPTPPGPPGDSRGLPVIAAFAAMLLSAFALAWKRRRQATARA